MAKFVWLNGRRVRIADLGEDITYFFLKLEGLIAEVGPFPPTCLDWQEMLECAACLRKYLPDADKTEGGTQ